MHAEVVNNKGYGKYLVFFVDMLGTQNRKNFDELYYINKTFHENFEINQQNDTEERAYRRKIYTFSDCAYIFYYFKENLEESSKDLGKLFTVALCNCELLFLTFLKERIVFRGGITYGNAYIDPNRSMFFGEAVNRAYQMESKEAIHPRIIIDEFVAEKFNENVKEVNCRILSSAKGQNCLAETGLQSEFDPLTGYGLIEKDIDQKYIFNYLHFPEYDIISPGYYTDGDRFINELVEYANEQIKNLSDYRVIDKYQYLKRFCLSKIRSAQSLDLNL